MKKNQWIVTCVAFLLLMACNASKEATGGNQMNALSKKEKSDGWRLLFDGKSTAGWHTYNRDTVSRNWQVVDGILMSDPKRKSGRGMEDLVTDNDYENYELSLEWRISEGGNSGILINVKEESRLANSFTSGPEMQILDNLKAADNKKENHLAGLLYDMYGTADLSKPKPVGEWNEARIIQKAGNLTFYFNGVKTLDVQQGSETWKKLIENSKFKTWKDFASSPKGKIALQDHGNAVWFRNIKIRAL